MSLSIEYIEKTTSNLYVIVFNSAGQAYNTSTNLFTTYTDSGIASFYTNLSQDGNRSNRYSVTISNTTNFTKGWYTVEVWQRVGASPNKTNDFQKGLSTIYWDGVQENPYLSVPELSGPTFIGQRYIGAVTTWLMNSYDEYGQLCDTSGLPTYRVYYNGSALTPDITGFMSKISTGLYYGTFTASAGAFAVDNQYNIQISAIYNQLTLGTSRSFQTVTPGTAGDILTTLGYSSGVIGGFPTSSSFITNSAVTTDHYFNGGILRIVSTGSLYGQAGIVYDYDGTGKRFYMNKAFTSIPASGTQYILFPIGGELNRN